MKNNYSLLYSFFLVVGDSLALVAAFAGAYILRVSLSHKVLENPVHARTYIGVFLVLLPFWILTFALMGLYNNAIHEKRFNEAGRLLVGSFIGMLFVVFWDFLAPKPILPARLVPLYGFGLAFLFLVTFRSAARTLRIMLMKVGIGITKILIVGNTKIANELIESLSDSTKSGYEIIGIVGSHHHDGVKVFNDFEAACKSSSSKALNGIIQTELYADTTKNDAILNFAQANHIAYRFIPG